MHWPDTLSGSIRHTVLVVQNVKLCMSNADVLTLLLSTGSEDDYLTRYQPNAIAIMFAGVVYRGFRDGAFIDLERA